MKHIQVYFFAQFQETGTINLEPCPHPLLMLTFPLHENVSSTTFIFLPPVFPHLGIFLVSLELVLSLVMMLTGSNAFRGLKGKRRRVILENG